METAEQAQAREAMEEAARAYAAAGAAYLAALNATDEERTNARESLVDELRDCWRDGDLPFEEASLAEQIGFARQMDEEDAAAEAALAAKREGDGDADKQAS